MQTVTFTHKSTLKVALGALWMRFYTSYWTIALLGYVFISQVALLLMRKIAFKDFIKGWTALILFLAFIALVVFVRLKQAYKTTPSAGEESQWKIDNNGIEIKKSTLSITLGWDNIRKVETNKKWVLIYLNKIQCLYIPKEKITEHDLLEIKHLLFTQKLSFKSKA